MGLGVLNSIMFAAPLLTALKDHEPRIKAHTARVLARRSGRSADVAPRGERKRPAAVPAGTEPATVPDDVPAPAAVAAGSAPRPGTRPTANRNAGRGNRPGGAGNRPSGGKKRR
jgi:preprotein translocase subunit SecF